MSEYKRKFSRRSNPLTTEDKIKSFVLHNSKNGFFTKVSTISKKFSISEDVMWDAIGTLLVEGTLESTHDQKTGEMRLCETGKSYEILGINKNRKKTSRHLGEKKK